MSAEKLRYYFLLIVALLVVINAVHSYELIALVEKAIPKEVRFSSPGERVFPLKPYLRNVPFAGYCTDRYSKNFWYDPPAASIYQAHQYALAPTQLDIAHCTGYDYVIFDCHNMGCQVPFLKEWRADVVKDIDGHIILVHKGKTK